MVVVVVVEVVAEDGGGGRGGAAEDELVHVGHVATVDVREDVLDLVARPRRPKIQFDLHRSVDIESCSEAASGSCWSGWDSQWAV